MSGRNRSASSNSTNMCRHRCTGWINWAMISDSNSDRSEEHTSELQSRENLVCRLLLEKKNTPHDAAPIARTRRAPLGAGQRVVIPDTTARSRIDVPPSVPSLVLRLILKFSFGFEYGYAPRAPLSFPTRRSSDLQPLRQLELDEHVPPPLHRLDQLGHDFRLELGRPRAQPLPHILGPQLLDVRHDGVVENPQHRRRHPIHRSRLLPRQLDQLDNPRM